MDPIIGGALISAGSSLASKLFGDSGPDPKKTSPGDAFHSEFSQRMKMAERFGISKLVMAGAPASSGWSGSVGGGEPSWGDTFASMGQDLGRAVAAKASAPERQLQALLLDKAGLENEFLRTQIASVKMRTLRESAPALPIPDRSGGRLPVAHPMLGQEAENHYSDIGGNIFGGAALVNDSDAAANQWFIDKLGFDPRQYTPWALGARSGQAVRGYLKDWWNPPKGSTHYKNR